MAAWLAKFKLELIENWRSAWRFWSIRLGLLGTAVAAFFAASPDAAYQAWVMLPEDLKTFVPEGYARMLGAFLFATSMLARIFKQNKLQTQVVKSIEVTPAPAAAPHSEPTVKVEVATVDAPPADDAR